MSFQRKDLKTHILLLIKMLRLNGIWPKSDKYFEFSAYFFYQVYYQIALSVHFISNLIETVFRAGDFNDKLLSAVIFPEYFICHIKRLVHTVKWNTAVAILKDLDKDELQPKNDKQMRIFNKAFKLWTFSFNLFFSMQFIVSFFFLIQPYFSDLRSRKKLIFPSWYPIDVSEFPFYDVIHVYQMYALFLAAMSTIGLDSFCGALMTYVAAECDILCDTLEHLREETEKRVKTNTSKIDYESQIIQGLNDTLIECIVHHNIILSLSRKVNNYLNLMVMTQCFVYVTFASFALFALSVVESKTAKFIMGMSLLLSFIQLTQYCWMGNEVLVKSSLIPLAAYKGYCVEGCKEYQDNLRFFIFRTQRPIVFSAYNFFYLCSTSLITIMRTTFSYFTFLSQVYEKQQ